MGRCIVSEQPTDYYHEWLAQGKEIARLQARVKELIDQVYYLQTELNKERGRPSILKEFFG